MNHRRLTRAGRAAIIIIGAGVTFPMVAGCETITEDLTDMAKGLIPPSPGEVARMAVDPDNADRRREGTLMLANAHFGGEDVYVRLFRDYAEHEADPLVRAVALRGLARHGEPSDAMLMAEQLEHANVVVRWEAAKGLQRLHESAVVPALVERLGDAEEQVDVRVAAATALGQYAEDRAFQGLIGALDARELAVNVAADRSLQTLTGQRLGLDSRSWLTWYNGVSGDPFAHRREYLYPTYQRQPSWLDRMVFWTPRTDEEPGRPRGIDGEGGTEIQSSPIGDPGGGEPTT